jgi:hypothetical protein
MGYIRLQRDRVWGERINWLASDMCQTPAFAESAGALHQYSGVWRLQVFEESQILLDQVEILTPAGYYDAK